MVNVRDFNVIHKGWASFQQLHLVIWETLMRTLESIGTVHTAPCQVRLITLCDTGFQQRSPDWDRRKPGSSSGSSRTSVLLWGWGAPGILVSLAIKGFPPRSPGYTSCHDPFLLASTVFSEEGVKATS